MDGLEKSTKGELKSIDSEESKIKRMPKIKITELELKTKRNKPIKYYH